MCIRDSIQWQATMNAQKNGQNNEYAGCVQNIEAIKGVEVNGQGFGATASILYFKSSVKTAKTVLGFQCVSQVLTANTGRTIADLELKKQKPSMKILLGFLKEKSLYKELYLAALKQNKNYEIKEVHTVAPKVVRSVENKMVLNVLLAPKGVDYSAANKILHKFMNVRIHFIIGGIRTSSPTYNCFKIEFQEIISSQQPAYNYGGITSAG